jgi:hypothetical protein
LYPCIYTLVTMHVVDNRRRKSKCDHEDCTKQTKARFCEEHLPLCVKCGKKCRKFEDREILDLANVFCFQHSQYLRDKTREKIARYRARDREIKQERKIAIEEIQSIVAPLVLESKISYLEQEFPYPIEDFEWDEFILWMRNHNHDNWLKYDMFQDAIIVMDGLSGRELEEYKDSILTAFRDLDVAIEEMKIID